MPPDHEIVPRVPGAVELGIDFLLRACVREGPFAGAFPCHIAKVTIGGLELEDANERVNEGRVDYVQHALYPLIRYQSRTAGD